jgi:hypothetical protein
MRIHRHIRRLIQKYPGAAEEVTVYAGDIHAEELTMTKGDSALEKYRRS